MKNCRCWDPTPEQMNQILDWVGWGGGGGLDALYVLRVENPSLTEISMNSSWFGLNTLDMSLFRIASGNWRTI